MDTVTQFPRQVREIENLFITLADGCRLAARIWLPKDAEKNPVPAILEYLPYRKSDGTSERDQLTHPYFAGNGYACVRVDIRGSGESDGLLEDEYPKSEQDDCLEVLSWIAAQRNGSGGKGSGLRRTIDNLVRSLSRPASRSRQTWAPNRDDPTPSPV